MPFRPFIAASILVVALVACRATPDPAREIESHLYAPCCWRQLLADHESPVATQMRAEIRERLAAGESADAIEQGFVARYGERVLAVGTSGPGPGVMIGVFTAISAILGLWVLARVMGRRRCALVLAALTPKVIVEDDVVADRLDDELAAMD